MDKNTFKTHWKTARDAAGNPSAKEVKSIVDDPTREPENPQLQPLMVFIKWAHDQVPMEWFDEVIAPIEANEESERLKNTISKLLPQLRLKNQLDIKGDSNWDDASIISTIISALEKLELTSDDAQNLKSVKINQLGEVHWTGSFRGERSNMIFVGVELSILKGSRMTNHRARVRIDLVN